ncbi:MAG: DUF349 domain-containing protein [Bacteroidales bacterium]|nr:DUF349 domain-containing protein [Bacteroidales bacterium]
MEFDDQLQKDSLTVENELENTQDTASTDASPADAPSVAEPSAAEPTPETTGETPAEKPSEEPVEAPQPLAEVPTDEAEPVADESVTPDAPAPTAEADSADVQLAEPAAEEAPAAEPEFVEPEADFSQMSREEMAEALRTLLQDDVSHIKNRVSQLRTLFNEANREAQRAEFEAFLADGGDKETYEQHNDAVANTFYDLYSRYRTLRQQRQDEQEAAKQHNLDQKRQLIDELRVLVESDEPLKKIYDAFNAIQERWKTIGDVPRAEANDLWQNYHFQVEQFFKKVNINKELKMLDMKKNLEQKLALCEKAEELMMEPMVNKAFKELQTLREQWKATGPVPNDKNDEVWTRFCAAADKVNERHKEYYEQRKEELHKNLLAKQALVDKAVELTATPPTGAMAWGNVSKELEEMRQLWRTIGPVPQEQNEEVWRKFKTTLDGFYKQKKQFFARLKDSQTENLNKKIDLCLKAEAIAQRDDWKKATEEMLQLQQEWKSIGSVAYKQSDAIWTRFRAACDTFFNRKNEYFGNRRSTEKANLESKEAILAELKSYAFGEDREANLNAIKDFQRRWIEVGHVPIAEKDRLQKEFRGVINDYFERLQVSAREAETLAFRERVRERAGNAGFVTGARAELQSKIEKMQNDLKLWENNLGFLSDSKQADLLKNEFEKKMQHTRQQIALMEAKLRVLNESEQQDADPSDAQ